MYERSPQKSPQLMILNRRSLLLTDHPDVWAPVPKSVCRVSKWVSGYPGKRSRQIRNNSSNHCERIKEGSKGMILTDAAPDLVIPFPRRDRMKELLQAVSP